MAVRQKKTAIKLFVEGQPPQKALIIATNVGPGPVKRLAILVGRLIAIGMRVFGLGLAGVGAAHFVVPKAFEPLTKLAFPQDTQRWTYRNGGTEVALGLALTSRRTRILGGIAGVAYAAFLGTRFVGNAGKR